MKVAISLSIRVEGLTFRFRGFREGVRSWVLVFAVQARIVWGLEVWVWVL